MTVASIAEGARSNLSSYARRTLNLIMEPKGVVAVSMLAIAFAFIAGGGYSLATADVVAGSEEMITPIVLIMLGIEILMPAAIWWLMLLAETPDD